ncbi:hypothetical protein AB205_0212540, partial [Aquarana catesbeiana]
MGGSDILTSLPPCNGMEPSGGHLPLTQLHTTDREGSDGLRHYRRLRHSEVEINIPRNVVRQPAAENECQLCCVLRITPFEASLVLCIGKIWGGITDPIVGYFINKSRWTRIGRLMPWYTFVGMLGSMPFLVVSYFFLWFVPSFVTGRVLWYLIFFCSFQALSTIYHVPYTTLTMFLSAKQSERDSATAYRAQPPSTGDPSRQLDPRLCSPDCQTRMTVEVLGTLIGAALQGQIVASAHTAHHCHVINRTMNFTVNATNSMENITFFIPGTPDYQLHALCHLLEMSYQTDLQTRLGRVTLILLRVFWFHETLPERGYLQLPLCADERTMNVYMIAAGVIGCIYLFCTAVLFLGIKEKDDPYAFQPGMIIPFCSGFRQSMQHGPYLFLTFSFLLISAGVQLQQSNFVLFCTHAADNLRKHFQNLVLTILISAVVSIPFWQWFLQRFGKKKAAFGIS